MLDQGRASAPVAGDDVYHAGRQPRINADIGKQQRRQRRIFRRLQHHCVAGGQRRGDLPGQHQGGKIPRDNLANNAQRHLALKFAFQQLGPAGVVIKMPGDQGNIDVAAFADRLAVIQGFNDSEQPRVFLDRARQGVEVARPRRAAKAGPRPLRRTRRVNGGINITRSALCQGRQFFPGRRVGAVKGFTGNTGFSGSAGHPLPAYEMTKTIAVAGQPGVRLAAALGGGAILHGV